MVYTVIVIAQHKMNTMNAKEIKTQPTDPIDLLLLSDCFGIHWTTLTVMLSNCVMVPALGLMYALCV